MVRLMRFYRRLILMGYHLNRFELDRIVLRLTFGSKPGDSLQSRVPAWLREKVDRDLIPDVGRRSGNVPR